MAGARGGARPGAGRKPSAVTVRTRAAAEKLSKDGEITPLEVLTMTMRALWKQAIDSKGNVQHIPIAKEASEIAEKVAPYMHPRLASVEQFVDAKVRQFAVSAEELTADEWDRAYGPLATAGGASESAH